MFTILASAIHEQASFVAFRNYYAMGDNGATYEVFSVVDGNVFVQGRHGNLGRLVQTGQKVSREGLVRSRIDFAIDLGDAQGTLLFGDGEHIGAYANFRLFESQED